jgi:HEAT repeat protein
MLAVAFGNMSTPAAVDVLIELPQDDEVAGHAIIGLGNHKATAARSAIEGFLRHPKSWIRAEARKALKKIGTSGLR